MLIWSLSYDRDFDNIAWKKGNKKILFLLKPHRDLWNVCFCLGYNAHNFEKKNFFDTKVVFCESTSKFA